MVGIDFSKVGNRLKVFANGKEINCIIVDKPFYDPKKKIASS